ncbi:MAG: saccharopine dehydrogenase C-terminal domain-containing protein, partial [Acidobacteriota bacterium]
LARAPTWPRVVVAAARAPAPPAAPRAAAHPRGRTQVIDAQDSDALDAIVSGARAVVHMLPPRFQPAIARACVKHGATFASASYRAAETAALDRAARDAGVALVCETGLDPGIDLMTAAQTIDAVHADGGKVLRFASYGGGLPALDARDRNPLGYAITWNPRNVAMAGESGAVYLRQGRVRRVTHDRLFRTTWPVDVPGLARFEAYPNRDALPYRAILDIPEAHTLMRGTLRYPGFCEIWDAVVRLGLADELHALPARAGDGDDAAATTYRALVAMSLAVGSDDEDADGLQLRVASALGLHPTGAALRALRWLGLFDDAPIPDGARTPAEALAHLLIDRLPLDDDAADLVVLHHEFDVRDADGGHRRLTSTFHHVGTPGGDTAMATTVGLPTAFAIDLAMTERLVDDAGQRLVGVHVPTAPALYRPLLDALDKAALTVHERAQALPDPPPTTPEQRA